MKELNQNEILSIHGGAATYTFSYVIEETIAGATIGAICGFFFCRTWDSMGYVTAISATISGGIAGLRMIGQQMDNHLMT